MSDSTLPMMHQDRAAQQDVDTATNVEEAYPGGLLRRFFASIADSLIIPIFVLLLSSLVIFLIVYTGAVSALTNEDFYLIVIVLACGSFVIPTIFEALSCQATPGKILMRLWVEDCDGKRAPFEAIVKRNILKYITAVASIVAVLATTEPSFIVAIFSFVFSLGAALYSLVDVCVLLLSPNRRSLHCQMSDTRVSASGDFPVFAAIGIVLGYFLVFATTFLLLQRTGGQLCIGPACHRADTVAPSYTYESEPVYPSTEFETDLGEPTWADEDAADEDIRGTVEGLVQVDGVGIALDRFFIAHVEETETLLIQAQSSDDSLDFSALIRFKPFQRTCNVFAVQYIDISFQYNDEQREFRRNPALASEDDIQFIQCELRPPYQLSLSMEGEAEGTQWTIIVHEYDVASAAEVP